MRGIAEYKAVNVGSASKEELVVMLFEAAIRNNLRPEMRGFYPHEISTTQEAYTRSYRLKLGLKKEEYWEFASRA